MIHTELSPLVQFGISSKERVENALEQLKSGKGVLVTDDENRENEGDLIFSAQHINVQDMAIMIRECSGIVCLCLTNEKADELRLPYMVTENTSSFQTPFTITIEAKSGVTTGVSAQDRITTIKTAIASNAKPEDSSKAWTCFPS